MSSAIPKPSKTVSVKLDLEIRARIEHLAESRDRSPHWVMREAIRQYVEQEEKRDAFRQDVIQAWEEFQETSVYATSVDVDRWLASWGTDNELPAPLYHP